VKVFVVSADSSGYEGDYTTRVFGVFSTEEKAEAYKETLSGMYRHEAEISDYELDDGEAE